MKRLYAAALAAAMLSGCSVLQSLNIFTPDKPKPAELTANPNLIAVKQAWSANIGRIDFPVDIRAVGSNAYVANAAGTVVAIEGASGRELWRANAGAPVAAGVGSDGTLTSVVTRTNEVVTFEAGKELWRYRLAAQGYTAPFVAGNRVFVLGGDRSVTALDGRTGAKLWATNRPSEPLVLRQPGVILAVGDTLVVGQGGRLTGLNPLNGTVRWDSAIATPRGINDVERLVDLVGRVSREGNVICARAFQTAVGCVDATRGGTMWTVRANGAVGVHGDALNVFGSEQDGHVISWKRDSGSRAWSSDLLLHRALTAPLVLGRSVIVGDGFGFVHMLSRENGSLLNRLATDGSAIVGAPTVVGNTLIVATANGGLFGFVPQ